MFCELTYVCALASAHTQNLFVYMHILTSIHISYYRYFCIWLRVVRTHICLCPCERSHLEPLYTYSQVYTNRIIDTLYMNPCWANWHMCVCVCPCLARTMGWDKSLYLTTYLYIVHIYIYVKFSFGTHGLIFPFFSISHWTFFPKWMAIRVCKHCRKRAAKLKWQ